MRSAHTALLTVAALLLPACASTTTTTPTPPSLSATSQQETQPARVLNQAPAAAVTREAWSFRGNPGQIIRTTHYRIFTTDPDSIITDRLTLLVEEAMRRYRTAITDLPAPPMRLDTYLMQNRPQWEQVTRLIIAEHADTLVRIERGGFATRGVAVYFNIGRADTMSIAAHEGWHQYTQRTFRSRLPIWLEEAIAVYHEGHRWEGARPVFLPWANPERYDRLREAVTAGRFIPFTTLITMTPNDYLQAGSPNILDFYAHVWAAAHFLCESPNLRPALAAILQDAAAGRLRSSFANSSQSPRNHRSVSDPILSYLSMDPDALDQRFEAFVREIVRPGGRDRMISGHSPIPTLSQ